MYDMKPRGKSGSESGGEGEMSYEHREVRQREVWVMWVFSAA